jgi:hypothetical protein
MLHDFTAVVWPDVVVAGQHWSSHQVQAPKRAVAMRIEHLSPPNGLGLISAPEKIDSMHEEKIKHEMIDDVWNSRRQAV